MQDIVVFKCEYFLVIKRREDFYIESYKRGMTLELFNKFLKEHPEIKITSVIVLRNALMNAPKILEKFGEVKDRISIEISDDGLKAFMTLCVREDELSGSAKGELYKEVLRKLMDTGVVFGIKNSAILGGLCNNKQVLVAEGIPSIDGEDSEIRMYELKDVKPEIKEDGNVDHYELNLINRVAPGAWLGERTDPTEGTPGKTVRGQTIMPAKGKYDPLFYDKNTVTEEREEGKTILYSKISGAVHYDGDRISVSNHLEITSNVDFKTGNIDFDGFLTVKGSVEDNFSIEAKKDIEILGDYGLGSVKGIVSNEGSIYIKGGVAGKNKAVVRSKKNIYTKFVSDTSIICDGSVHIGFYCLNSNITAKEVILDSPKGQIIGGNIKAEIRIVASTVGSNSEKRTFLSVTGFNRNSLKSKFDKTAADIEKLKVELAKTKQEVAVYSNTTGLTKEQCSEFERVKEKFFDIKDSLKQLEEDRKALSGYLRTHGEGEISVLKKIYPNCVLEIKGIIKEMDRPMMATSFYVQDGDIKEL